MADDPGKSFNLANVDLNLLVTFDAIMSERNVTRAGNRVGRTQPAMSAALSRLRHLFADELFVRGPGGLEPTPRALDLSEPIARALASAEEALAVVRQFRPDAATGLFRLGLSEHPLHMLLPSLMAALHQVAPKITMDIRLISDRDDAARMLEAGEVDAAIGVPVSASPRILRRDLFTETFVCVVRTGHPAASGNLTPERFARLDHLLVSPEGDRFGHVDRKLEEFGLARHLALALPSMYAVPAVVAKTDLIATIMGGVVRAAAMEDRLAVFAPPVEMPVVPFQLFWHRRANTHAGQIWFRDLITEVAFLVTVASETSA